MSDRPHRRLALAVVLLSGATPAQDRAADGKAPVDPGLFAGLHYRCVGPSRGGRVTTVAGVAQRPGEFYMGTTGGGVWKTTDFGATWRNVSDGCFASPSTGAIRVAPSDPDVVWVGTGSDGLRSNVIRGRGVYRSTDAGRTWSFAGLRDTGHIGAVEVHPSDPEVAWVAAIGQAFQPNAERGVYKTIDGGKTWKRVLFVSDRIGAVDLELHPADPDTIYACTWRAERKPWTIISGAEGCGLQRSTDGGATWRKLGGGLPGGVVGKSDLAVSRAAPDRVYALIEAAPGKGGVYRSDDRGESFRLVSTEAGLLDRPFYYCNIDADPNDADTLYVNSTRFYRSTDAGRTWRTRPTPHSDNHDIWIHPDNSRVMIQCNDGGANVSIDGGATWSTQSNQPTAELYQVAVDDRFPYWLYAGQQDNSTIRVPSLPPYPAPAGPQAYWQSIGGCETGPAIPKPGDADIVYANCKGRFGRFNFRTGQEQHFYVGAANMYGHNPKDLKYRFQRVAPIAVSPHDPDTVYHASQFLHRSRDEGRTWEAISPDLTAFEPDKQVISGAPLTRDITGEEFYSTIYAVAESTVQKGLIWCGANDGPVHVTRDGGATWNEVSPSELPKGGRVQTVAPSPHRAGKCYLSVLRYQLGDWRPHVYRTDDFGKTWTRVTVGIPDDTPTRVVREDPTREGLLYAGTESGVYVSFDDGALWQPMQMNLPVTPVTDMRVHRGDLVLSTMGRSFWILDDLSRVRQLAKGALAEGVHLFAPAPAYRVRLPRAGGGSGVQYQAAGASIDYRLAEDARELRLEIVDAAGKVVRTVTSGSGRRGRGRQGRPDERTPDSSMPARGRAPAPALSGRAGAHRYRWDLRHDAAPTSGAAGRRGGNGPLVVPGRYTVRLTAGDVTRQAPLEVRLDPRVEADGVTLDDLRAQEALCLQVRDLGARVRAFAASLERRLRDEPGSDKLQRLRDQVTTPAGRYMTPMLGDQVRYLASMIDQADQRPGEDAYARLAELEAWFARVRREL